MIIKNTFTLRWFATRRRWTWTVSPTTCRPWCWASPSRCFAYFAYFAEVHPRGVLHILHIFLGITVEVFFIFCIIAYFAEHQHRGVRATLLCRELLAGLSGTKLNCDGERKCNSMTMWQCDAVMGKVSVIAEQLTVFCFAEAYCVPETKRNKQCYYGWLYLSTDSSKLMTIRDWTALLNPSPRRVNTPAPLSSHHSSPQSLYSKVSMNLFALVPRASSFPASSIR